MTGLPFSMLVEGSVAILLVVTIGYCMVLNRRLKRLHADRDTLRQMIADLVNATNLANGAIRELKSTAVEADLALATRLEEAEQFGIELASHVSAGQAVMERIAQITNAVRVQAAPAPTPAPARARSALEQLIARDRARENAA